jgi:polysaccharide biosynthesis/export protein
MKSIIAVVCLGGACCLAEGQTMPPPAPPPVPQTQTESPPNVLPPQRLGAGDLVNVSVYAAPELSRPVRVTTDGSVRLPLLNKPIQAANRMPDDVANSIAEELKAEQLLVEPLVSVTVTEYGSRPVVVTGAVRHPTTFQAYGDTTTLLTALAKADGLTPEAGPDLLVTIPQTSAGGTQTRSVQRIALKSLMSGSDPNLNLQLHGGEEIRIPEAEKVYVLGNVKKPGAFPVRDAADSSVLKVLALSEGLMPFAMKEAYIYRPDASGVRQEIPVPLSQIVDRKSPDVPLQGGDIFYVPDNRSRRLTVSWLERIAGFGSTTASGLLIWRR